MEKSTGWKVPLLFCCAIILIVATAKFLMPDKTDLPPLPLELLKKASAVIINLDSEEGSIWKEKIVQAGSGFISQDVKDRRLHEVVKNALQAQNMDAACVAATMIRDDNIREDALGEIFRYALQKEELLPYGVFVIKHSKNQQELTKILRERYSELTGNL